MKCDSSGVIHPLHNRVLMVLLWNIILFKLGSKEFDYTLSLLIYELVISIIRRRERNSSDTKVSTGQKCSVSCHSQQTTNYGRVINSVEPLLPEIDFLLASLMKLVQLNFQIDYTQSTRSAIQSGHRNVTSSYSIVFTLNTTTGNQKDLKGIHFGERFRIVPFSVTENVGLVWTEGETYALSTKGYQYGRGPQTNIEKKNTDVLTYRVASCHSFCRCSLLCRYICSRLFRKVLCKFRRVDRENSHKDSEKRITCAISYFNLSLGNQGFLNTLKHFIFVLEKTVAGGGLPYRQNE